MQLVLSICPWFRCSNELRSEKTARNLFLAVEHNAFPVVALTLEMKSVKQIAKRRPVNRNVGVVLFCDRVGEIVTAAVADRADVPVPLDEFVDGDVVAVGVRDVASGRILGNYQQRDSRAIAEKVHRLHVA